jgi:hypothetical protein
VGIFATRTRRLATDGPEAGRVLSDHEWLGLPSRFRAVGEALASGSGSAEACAVVGWDLAQEGAALPEVLDGLRAVYQRILGAEPSFEDISAVCMAWSESTLGYLHQISCEDPMTGLASLAHVRTRLGELYRGELRDKGDVNQRFALVIADTPSDAPWHRHSGDELGRAMRMTQLGDAARTVFCGHETVGQLNDHRIVVVVDRDERLGRRVALLRTLLGQPTAASTRVWIEGLPSSDLEAGHLLGELARP